MINNTNAIINKYYYTFKMQGHTPIYIQKNLIYPTRRKHGLLYILISFYFKNIYISFLSCHISVQVYKMKILYIQTHTNISSYLFFFFTSFLMPIHTYVNHWILSQIHLSRLLWYFYQFIRKLIALIFY